MFNIQSPFLKAILVLRSPKFTDFLLHIYNLNIGKYFMALIPISLTYFWKALPSQTNTQGFIVFTL